MENSRKYIFSFFFFILHGLYSPGNLFGQDSLFISGDGKMGLFESDSLAFFGPVLHNGVLNINKKNHTIMFGKIWSNGINAKILDGDGAEGSPDGGTIEFRQYGSASGATQMQWINCQYNSIQRKGPAFSNIIINNNDGVSLQTDVIVIHQINLLNGHLYLNGQTLVLGNDSLVGEIINYTDQRFFVTGEVPGSGLLVQRNLPKGVPGVFPLGSKDLAEGYTPLTITPNLFSEDIGASVFSKTYTRGITGYSMIDSSVNTSWQIKKGSGQNSYTISLEHNMFTEGAVFNRSRLNSYIGIYEQDQWHDISLKHSRPESPGLITTGNPINSSATNSTNFGPISMDSIYVSKFASQPLSINPSIVIPNVFTPNGDGKNDDFEIANINLFPDNEIVVYNRWGNEVFKTKQYSSSNKFNGRGLSEGTYFYVLKIKVSENTSLYKGYITLIR